MLSLAQQLNDIAKCGTAMEAAPKGLEATNARIERETLAKYRAAMAHGEWMTSRDLANAFGVKTTNPITETLRRPYLKAIVERRILITKNHAHKYQWRLLNARPQ